MSDPPLSEIDFKNKMSGLPLKYSQNTTSLNPAVIHWLRTPNENVTMNIKSINSIDSIENQSNRQANSGHSTPTTPQSPKIEKRASNDNFGGLNGMEKTEIIQKLINVQKQYVKVSHNDIIVGTYS